MSDLKLFMVLIGCRPKGRSIEQHDIFFGIAAHIKELVPAMISYWPEAKGKLHIDAWREVTFANGFEISVTKKSRSGNRVRGNSNLYFINLGGYKPMEFEEYHYKMVVAAADKASAIKLAKHTTFFKHTGYKGATAHIDDKYGIDIDDMALVQDILSEADRVQYSISLTPKPSGVDDELHIGYFKLDKLG